MKYMHVGIWVEVEMRGINLDRIVILRSNIKVFSITQSTKDLDMLTTREMKLPIYGTEITNIWPYAAISTVPHFSIARYIFVNVNRICMIL